MSRRKRVHDKLYRRVEMVGGRERVTYDFPRAKVEGTGKWLGTGQGVGQTVTLPKK